MNNHIPASDQGHEVMNAPELPLQCTSKEELPFNTPPTVETLPLCTETRL